MSTRKIEDEEPLPWADIEPPPKGRGVVAARRHIVRELGAILCDEYVINGGHDCLAVPRGCPLSADDEDLHDLTICIAGEECEDIWLVCDREHDSDDIIDAIASEIVGD